MHPAVLNTTNCQKLRPFVGTLRKQSLWGLRSTDRIDTAGWSHNAQIDPCTTHSAWWRKSTSSIKCSCCQWSYPYSASSTSNSSTRDHLCTTNCEPATGEWTFIG